MKFNLGDTITLDQYIHEALYNAKHGYYMNKNPFGKDGDYITAPNISVMFSEMIAIWIISYWKNLGSPKNFNLIELGAGNGEMMKQMIESFQKFPDFESSCNVNILEKSNFLKKIQKLKLKNKKIRWLKDLYQLDRLPGIFVANEFFDALPVKQFIKKDKLWYEKNVKFTQKKMKFVDISFNMKQFEKKIGFDISNDQNIIEFSPLAMDYLKTISNNIKNSSGGILIIDYGYVGKKIKNTLRAISNHKFTDVLHNFGKSDITHNINFNLISKIAKEFGLKSSKVTTQKKFLLKLGILERAEILSKNLSFSKKTDIYFRIKRLIDESSMGELFKVMLIAEKNTNFQIGF
jgi:NADH dehydrogenase [ubiquinone] 1 alpha subcomplex assembly factor 7